MSAPPLRLFVALELPEEVRDELVRWRSRALADESGLRGVSADGLHITLCFLGSLSGDAVPGILAACAGLSDMAAAQLAIRGPLWLPPRRPRVLSVSVDDAGHRLAAAQAALSDALAAGGWYEPEARAFRPHVTVARVRGGARVQARDLEAPAPLEFAGRRVTLFRSRTGRGGAVYEPLGTVRLRTL